MPPIFYRWIVDVRHDTSHGQLPSYEVLKAAVAFCFNWIIVNYWQFEDHTIESLADVTNYANYPFIHELLDCYKYLKIYSIWGSRNLKDIKDQTEIYQQLSRLVKQSLDLYFFHESQFFKVQSRWKYKFVKIYYYKLWLQGISMILIAYVKFTTLYFNLSFIYFIFQVFYFR